MKFVVLGGAGAMGRITVTDLVHTSGPNHEVWIADFDLQKAESLASSLSKATGANGPNIKAVFCNLKDVAASAQSLKGADVIMNCAQYQLNLEAMELALALRAHYTDLGGLFHYTQKQLKLDAQFRAIDRVAVIGMGAAPGITNCLAQLAASDLEQVREIHCRVGSSDQTRYEFTPALAVSYSLKTILEEFSYEPAVFTKGKMTFVKPMSGDLPHRFPKPIGLRKPMYTIHSEVATLPQSFTSRGVREVSFKIAFDPIFTDRVRFLRDLGLASHTMEKIGDAEVAPVDVVNRVAMAQSQPKPVGKLKQYEVVRSVVKGTQGGKKVTLVADCHTQGMPKWGIGLDIDTGSPPAVCAQMIAAGEITLRGVVAPEVAVPAKPFFARLREREMKVRVSKHAGWNFSV